MSLTARDVRYLTFLVLGLGVLLRVLYLDADSHYYESIGYITDEGRWVHHARNLALFDTSSRDRLYDLHLIVAPLFELTNYLIFELIGFSRFASRLWTALCGSALLLLFWRALRPTVTPQALFVGVALLAVQVDFVALSRLAVPEMVAVFFQGLAYFALVSPQRSSRKMFLPGLLLFIAIGMKATVAPVAAIFSVMILLMPRVDGEPAPNTSKWRDVLWFWAGLITPAFLAGSMWVACCLRESPVAVWRSSGAAGFLATLIEFIRFSTLYRILAFPFANALAPSINFLGLGLWLSWLGWMASQRDDVDARTRRYLITSAVWIIAYLSVSLALEYFPQRYKAHIMLPMAINITVGISLLQKVGMQKLLGSLQRNDRVQWLRLSVLALPTAVFLAPLIAYGIGLLGVDPEPLRVQLACVIAAAGISAYGAHRVKASDQALAFFIAFPLLQAALWLTLSLPVLMDASIWPTEHRDASVLLVIGSLATAIVATSVALRRDRWRGLAIGAIFSIYVIGHLSASLVRLAPTYIDPQYTIRNISRDLGTSLSGVPAVVTSRGEGLFNDNSLRYHRFQGGQARSEGPEIVVTVFEMSRRNRTTLEQQYHVIKTFTPYVSPDYFAVHPADLAPEVRVYKRNDE